MPLVENKTKLKLKNNELALGFGVHHLRTSATAMLAAAADHDWLFIDMEHGADSVHEAAQLCIAALPTGVTPIVRICAGALDEGTRCLDNGALGVIVPHVDTAERAQEIARAFRYPPLGTRSWGGPPAPYGFRAPGNAEAQAALNEAVLVVAMIESPQAVGNAEAIAAVDGVDLLYAGSDRIDQSGSLNDFRLGGTKEWEPGHVLEVILLRNTTNMRHDVHFTTSVYNPTLHNWTSASRSGRPSSRRSAPWPASPAMPRSTCRWTRR